MKSEDKSQIALEKGTHTHFREIEKCLAGSTYGEPETNGDQSVHKSYLSSFAGKEKVEME